MRRASSAALIEGIHWRCSSPSSVVWMTNLSDQVGMRPQHAHDHSDQWTSELPATQNTQQAIKWNMSQSTSQHARWVLPSSEICLSQSRHTIIECWVQSSKPSSHKWLVQKPAVYLTFHYARGHLPSHQASLSESFDKYQYYLVAEPYLCQHVTQSLSEKNMATFIP